MVPTEIPSSLIAKRATLLMLRLIFEVALLTTILALAAYLRMVNVGSNPAWYTDEATHIDIAHHLADGEMRYMAVQDSTLLFGRVPLFHLVLAGLYQRHPDADPIVVLRTFTGTLGVLSVALLYMVVRLSDDAVLALLAAFVLAIYPQAIVYSRFGFSYNLLAPLVLLTMLGLSRYAATRRAPWLALASLALGLGTVSDLAAFAFIVPFMLIVVLARRPFALLWSLTLLMLPFAIYTLVMLNRAPAAFLFDLRFTLSRLAPIPTLEGQLANLAHNYTELVAESIWFPLGIVGLFLLRPPRFAWVVLLMSLLPVAAIGRSFALYNLSAYYLIPFLPFVALGVASLIRAATVGLRRAVLDSLSRWRLPAPARHGFALSLMILAVLGLVWVPFARSFDTTLKAVEMGFQTPIDGFLITPADGYAVADYINARSTPNDIVIVSPVVGWLLNTSVSDFQMTAAARGRTTPHLPGELPPERWAFPMDYTAARYVVTDNLWYSWGVVHIPGLDEILQDVETWPVVFESGVLKVYENPRLNSRPPAGRVS